MTAYFQKSIHRFKIDIGSVGIIFEFLQLGQSWLDSFDLNQVHLERLVQITFSRISSSFEDKEVTIISELSTDSSEG